MADLTDREYDVLHHAIGSPKHAAQCRVPPWRDYFCAGAFGDDRDACDSLTAKGLMVKGRELPDYTYFHATPEGIKAVEARLPEMFKWRVETPYGESTVYAATRSAARADVVRDLRGVRNVSWLEALRGVKSVRKAVEVTP